MSAPPPTPAYPGVNARSAEMPIWPEGAPGKFVLEQSETRTIEDQKWRKIVVIKNVSTPTVTVVRPSGKANGSSMIILPGGAFGALAWDVEGTEVAQFLADRGITAFVLKYRVRTASPALLAKEGIAGWLTTGTTVAEADAEQAVRFVRSNAGSYGLDTRRVGMMGFSAGGLTTLKVLKDAPDDSRPDVAASIYGLLDPGARPKATPMFIAVAKDDLVDQAVSIDNLWRKAGAPSELHIFDSGGHGFGLGKPGTGSMAFPALFEKWLIKNHFATPVSR